MKEKKLLSSLYWKEKAQGMVEFALVLPVLMMLLLGIMEFGRLLFIYASVATASREGARYGSAAGDVGGKPRYFDCTGIKAAVNRVDFFNNIKDADITITYDNGPGTSKIAGGEKCEILSLSNINGIVGGKSRVIVNLNTVYEPIISFVGLNPFPINIQSARTIFSNIVVGRFPQNPSHVQNLEPIPPVGSCSGWCTRVRVTVHDEENNPVPNATVVGRWISKAGNPGNDVTCENEKKGTLPNGLSITTKSCPTSLAGVCEIQIDYKNSPPRAIFVVADIFHVEKAYDPTANIVSCIEFIP